MQGKGGFRVKNRIEYVFTSGFTAQGYYSYLPALLSRIERVIILQGAPGSGRSTFIRSIGLSLAERGYRVQFWPSPLDASYIDGVYLQQLKTVVISGDATGSTKIENHPGIMIHSIDLRDYYNLGELAGSQSEIATLTDQLESIMGVVKSSLEVAREGHKQLSDNYERLLNPGKLQALSQQLIATVLGEGEQATHYFARAITSEGVVDFFEDITRDCTQRYILQGPPGSGKSWVMRRIGEEALAQGHKVAFYHSGLDPDLLEMVVLQSLEIAIVDGDIVRVANRPGDTHINLTECWDDYDSINQPVINETERLVSNRVYQAVQGLTRARQVEKKLSKLFTKAMRFEQVDARREELIKEILQME
jgi:hypothetical protein